MSTFSEDAITIPTRDVALAATLFVPEDPRRCTLIAPAMGVPATFYKAFARYLAGRGHVVMTFDYAGIGASPPRPKCTLAEWADQDLSSAVEALKARHPAIPLCFIGHSVGGQLFGLLGRPPIDRALLIASQSGYWRWWSGAFRLKMLFLWFVVTPILVPLFGKLPKWLLGGSDVPKGVAMQWGAWGRDPDYVRGFAKARSNESSFDRFTGPLRCVAFSDDALAPELAAVNLHDCYVGAEKEFHMISPRDAGLESIGHFGAFRSSSEQLWEDFATYLERGS